MPPVSETQTKWTVAFDLIARYAEERGWIPIGFRSWQIGPWKIAVNGTRDERESIPPFHAMVTNDDYLGVMVVNPMSGTVGGWIGMEDAFIDAMRSELQGQP